MLISIKLWVSRISVIDVTNSLGVKRFQQFNSPIGCSIHTIFVQRDQHQLYSCTLEFTAAILQSSPYRLQTSIRSTFLIEARLKNITDRGCPTKKNCWITNNINDYSIIWIIQQNVWHIFWATVAYSKSFRHIAL